MGKVVLELGYLELITVCPRKDLLGQTNHIESGLMQRGTEELWQNSRPRHPKVVELDLLATRCRSLVVGISDYMQRYSSLPHDEIPVLDSFDERK